MADHNAEKAAAYRQNDDGSWSPGQPLGWLEEHGIVARLVFWIRGVGHCGKPGRRRTPPETRA